MCGIVGFVGYGRVAPSLQRAQNALAHRGPDDGNVWRSADETVALGHRRLSIVDLSSAGRGPFVKDGLVMTYNGEVYNYLELRGSLEREGVRFRSGTDTEVVLEAYRRYGVDFAKRLRGMFALAIWDESKRTLVVARDRIGIKPLFVYRDAHCVAFASELKALEAIDGLTLETDESAAYDFLSYLYVPAPKTIYTNVTKLLPAHVAIHTPERVTSSRYWSVDFAAGGGPVADEAREALLASLDDATRAHLVADVPLGCLLSGGVDSSAIAFFASKHLTEPLKTFSIGFDVASHSETPYAREVANLIGADHTERIVSLNDAKRELPTLTRLYDEPFGDLSALPTLEVCKLARERVTVALSGDGGDEVFGGYTSYARHLRRARWYSWVPPDLSRSRFSDWLEQTPLMRLRGIPTLVDGFRDPLERHLVIQGGLSKRQKSRLLPERVVRRYRDYDDLWALRAHDRPDLDPITRFQIIDFSTYLPDDILVKVDRASMACSLEVRPPLLDHHLVELVATIPSHVRTPKGTLKGLFKRAMTSRLPDSILNRAKKGFSVPLHVWSDALVQTTRSTTALSAMSVELLAEWSLRHEGPTWATSLSAKQ